MDRDELQKRQQDLMYHELQKVNQLIYKSFKKCVFTMTNKILGPNEKECIRNYLQKEKSYQEELLQALSKNNMRRGLEEINSIKQSFK
jgi:hypothetical protein